MGRHHLWLAPFEALLRFADELKALQERLAALQKQMGEIAAAQSQLNKRLDAAKAHSADLKTRYE